ncbi:MAG TPA: pyridoxal phosphate-dependent aminotransferase [Candidatus Thermoplasmatota archaeon]|nr:pyridoxal phosphate-dependent aminotransferase [Candidatus Thermoplasmatota archaeon]
MGTLGELNRFDAGPGVRGLIADRMGGVDMSGIRKMFEMAGKDAINFGIGEPDFQPPDFVIDAYVKALRDGHNKYGPSAGLPELRSAIANRERDRWPAVDAQHVVVTTGSTAALYAAMAAFVNPGEEVLCPNPGFVLYGPHTRLVRGVPVFYPLRPEHGFVPQVADLEALVTRKTKILVINSPSNPTGAIIPKKQVKALVDFAASHNLVIVSDEAYDSLTYEEPHTSFLGKYENVIYMNTFSKTYAMTGWRIGYVVARPEFADAIKKMSYHLAACPPTPTQHACLAALEGPQDFVAAMKTEFRARRDMLMKRIREIPGWDCVTPQGAFYAFPRYGLPMEARDVALLLLRAGVVTIPGDAFGPAGRGHLRISYSTSADKIEKGCDIIEKAVRGHLSTLA